MGTWISVRLYDETDGKFVTRWDVEASSALEALDEIAARIEDHHAFRTVRRLQIQQMSTPGEYLTVLFGTVGAKHATRWAFVYRMRVESESRRVRTLGIDARRGIEFSELCEPAAGTDAPWWAAGSGPLDSEMPVMRRLAGRSELVPLPPPVRPSVRHG